MPRPFLYLLFHNHNDDVRDFDASCCCSGYGDIYIFQRFRIGSQAATELELDELPQEVYEGDNDSDEEMCSICINGYDRGDQLVRLPCDHRFHRDCIASWLRIKRICPLCRHDIREPVEL